jgi:hypothetical protein
MFSLNLVQQNMVADLADGQLLPQSCPKAAPKADWLAEKEEALILFTTVQSAKNI